MALDAETLTDCYRKLERPLFNVVYRLLWDREETQDVIHEAFLKVWRRRAKVTRDRLEALVYTAALNQARNRLRWNRLRRWVALDGLEGADGEGSPTPPENPERAADASRIRRALAELPKVSQQVLLLSLFAGLDTREVAGLLSISPGTVGSRKHAAIKRLRERMENGDG